MIIMHNIFAFAFILVINFSSYSSEPQISKQSIYPENQNEIINIGNGYNRRNFVIIDERRRGRANQDPRFTNPYTPKGQTNSQNGKGTLPSRFGSDASDGFDNSRTVTFNTPGRGVTTSTNIGNGYNNYNTVVIQESDYRRQPANQPTNTRYQPLNTRYQPLNTPKSHYNSNANTGQIPVDTRIYNRIYNSNRSFTMGNTKNPSQGRASQDRSFTNPYTPEGQTNLQNGQGTITSRFSSDASVGFDNSRPVTINTPGRGVTTFRNIGNGYNNHNTVIIEESDSDVGPTDVVISPYNNNRRQPANQPTNMRYQPSITQKSHYNSNENTQFIYKNQETNTGQIPVNTRIYGRIGRGPNNHNLVIVNGKVVTSELNDLNSTMGNPSQSEQYTSYINNQKDYSEDRLKVLPFQRKT